MPKGKRKGKFEHKRTEQPSSSDEDAGICMINDNCSETSTQSDLKSNHDEVENDLQEKFEEKVMETIDALNAKSNAARALAFTSLTAALQRRPLSHLLTNHRATLADHVTRSLRRGKGAERKAAATIAPILSLQIGEDWIEEFVQEVRPALQATATDKSASIDTRTECCSTLAVLCYLAEDDIAVIMEIMRIYETIFSGSYLKGDGSVKVTGVALEEGPLHAAALDSWTLLFTLLPQDVATHTISHLPPTVDKLTELLHACTLEVRLAAGGALAVVHECVSDAESGECPVEPEIEAALPQLEQLTTESHKYRAKKDRKIQRATFRDILKYFEEDIIPIVSARCGTETVSCDTWSGRCAYGALAATLGTGLHSLLATSSTLRDALRLPPPAHLPQPKAKMNKLQRHLQNAAAFKARTLARNKSRDKRSAALAL